jgi:hypothetical protein
MNTSDNQSLKFSILYFLDFMPFFHKKKLRFWNKY